jgi:HAE1 family hydrophobic/amphiphilic exporter-1
VGRPITVLMLFCALVLLGVVALSRLPVQLTPSGFDPAFMSVRVPYPGANPAEVEEEIVRPLETALFTVRGVDEVNCRASNDSAGCWIRFANFVDMEETYNIVADRVERLRATEWPDDVEEVRLRRYNPENDATMHVGIRLPTDLDDPYWLLQNRVVQRLERVPGVAQVDLEGVQEKQIFIEPDRDAMASHRISLWEMVRSLRRANFALASGDLREGERKLLVRSVARFEDQEAIENLPVRADGLRLKDVARVRYGEPVRDRASRLDGRDAAILEIFKESEANTVEVSAAVREALEELPREVPLLASAGVDVLFDQGDVIQGSIRQLRDTGLIGAVFAVLILYFFLRRLRVTLLITLAIPVSLLSCLVVMYFAGGTINVITMMGLIICMGMLVDNAVVVVENIDRHRQEGFAVREAALAGASEVALALTMATVTTIIVFLPMIIMSEAGMMRFMLSTLALPVVVSILASLVVAMLFIPLAASLLLRSESAREAARGGLARVANAAYDRLMAPLHRFYLTVLRWGLAHRGICVVVALATLALTLAWPFQEVEWQIQGRHQRGGRQARFWFSLPNSYSMEQSDQWFGRIETIFGEHREEFGIRHVQTRFWNNRGRIQVLLRDVDETDVTVEQAVEGLRALVPDAPGVQMYVNWQRGSGSEASLNVSLYGEDTATLAQISEEAERRLRRLPGLISVEPDLENALEEVRIRVDRELAQRYGVQPEAISGTVAAALRGQRLPRYRDGEKEIEIVVQFPEEDRQGIGKLASLQLGSASGKRIPLESVADLSINRGFGDIRRRDRRTVLNIQLNTTWDTLGPLREQVSGVMDGMEMPRGYSWDFGSQMRWERQDNRNMGFGLLVSIVFIYLIMGFLFESPLLPLSVMPSIALSWIGVFWMLWATGSKLDMMAAIGLILLAGVVVNNGIVLVDLINRLRARGLARNEAILEAGRLRFRPILMTALTTIMGMLPMAFGKANFVGFPYAGLGQTFVGGLLSSTALTLVIVPLFYTMLDDVAESLSVLVRGRGRAEAARASARP